MSILSEKSLLVRHKISRKSFRKYDKVISAEVAAKHGTDSKESGRYNKILLHPNYLKAINAAATKAYQYHITNTLPWEDEGTRILPSAQYSEYTRKEREFIAEFNSAVELFILEYSEAKREAEKRLNGMFDPADYPPVETLQSAYGIEITFYPVPDKADFRITLDSEERSKIESDLETRMNSALENAMSDLWARLRESVAHLRNQLQTFLAAGEGESKRLYSAWFDNVSAIVDIIPALNITADPMLTDLATRAKTELLEYSPDYLREQPSACEKVTKSADDILSVMSGYCGS